METQSKRFVTSDSHFLHQNIIQYCNRPVDYNRMIIENWNSVVSDNDIVYHLGDFSAGVGKIKNGYNRLKVIAKHLNGTKILIRGNHDWYKDQAYIDDFGFSEVHDYLVVDEFFLCHYPLVHDSYSKKFKNKIDFLNDEFDKSGCTTLIHGHAHLTHFPGKMNVSVDLNNFTPVIF